MEKEYKKEIKIALFTTLTTVVFTSLIDFIKSKPFFTTIRSILNWIWNELLSYKVHVWVVILIFVSFKLIVYFLKSIKKNSNLLPKFIDYKQDVFDNVTWKWEWYYDYESWEIYNIKPLCPNCNTSTQVLRGPLVETLRCPRCNNYQNLVKTTDDIIHIIHDNIDRNDYK